MRLLRGYGTRPRAAGNRRNSHQQVGAARASPLAFSLIASRPRHSSSLRTLASSSGRVTGVTVLLQDLHHALMRCLILWLVCAVLYVITFMPSFISSPECAHLSLNTCKPLFVFLHLILCCPSSYCIPHAILKCPMTILINYFPCLAAQRFLREDCSIRPLAQLFAYLQI